MIRVRAESDEDSRSVYVGFEGRGPEFADLVQRIKSIPGRQFSAKTKYWYIPLLEANIAEFRKAFPQAELGPSLLAYVNRGQQKSETVKKVEQLRRLKDIDITDYKFEYTKPFMHQKVSFEILRTLTNGANFSEMGAGKSQSAAHVANWRLRRALISSVLIVCPKSVISVWADPIDGELYKHCGVKPTDILVLDGPMKSRVKAALSKQRTWTIVNYEGLWRILEWLREDKLPLPKWDMIILDESTRIKNKSTKQTKACISLRPISKNRMILTGSPVTQSPLDLWSQIQFLDPDLLPYKDFYEYQNEFSIVTKTKLVGNVKIPIRREWKNLDLLNSIIEKFSVRYLKSECMDLPEKIYTTREVELTGDQREAYTKIREEFLLILKSGEKVTVSNLLAMITRLHQITSGHIRSDTKELHYFDSQAKLDLLDEVLDDAGVYDGATKAVVWCQYIPDIKLISQMLDKKDIPNVMFYGDTKDRGEVVREFQTGKAKVFVGQEETGGFGINLTAASLCIYFSETFKYEARIQSEARLHRPPQKNKVTYLSLIATLGTGPRGGKIQTIDSRIVDALKRKQDMSDVVTGDIVKRWMEESG